MQENARIFLLSLLPKAHARRGCEGREEGRERGYYHLHRKFDNAFLSLLFFLLQKLEYPTSSPYLADDVGVAAVYEDFNHTPIL